MYRNILMILTFLLNSANAFPQIYNNTTEVVSYRNRSISISVTKATVDKDTTSIELVLKNVDKDNIYLVEPLYDEAGLSITLSGNRNGNLLITYLDFASWSHFGHLPRMMLLRKNSTYKKLYKLALKDLKTEEGLNRLLVVDVGYFVNDERIHKLSLIKEKYIYPEKDDDVDHFFSKMIITSVGFFLI